LKDPWMQISSHDMKIISANNQAHGYVKPETGHEVPMVTDSRTA